MFDLSTTIWFPWLVYGSSLFLLGAFYFLGGLFLIIRFDEWTLEKFGRCMLPEGPIRWMLMWTLWPVFIVFSFWRVKAGAIDPTP